ncbi:formyltransferase family protein [Leptospira yasudae]|uniref:phosphoribosylglycinamide formyltransferase 1 n=1 Tax=Leptospira yasudae TaxID=2202201 RepID=A0A5F2AUS6_9LEPT|nr:formyltransferase family protein [Leptospira yasudae]TGL77742.1 hypothetical protein EHQ77_14100 [Leptospira yasudae]TGL81148.1 hypothetical protein EHQ83_14875 [Leptospira yasudae]TGL82567.1 hypothetical protein EHQ72_04290 [Leptospira yasudae]TGM95406.1 hypothetical protein EHR10_19855 [Leptospira yasudae]
MKIALLSTFTSVFLDLIIEQIYAQGLSIDCLILDSKGLSERDLKIIQERTGGFFSTYQPEKFESYAIPHFYVTNHNSDSAINIVKNRNIDVVVNAGTPRILGSNILQAPKVGVVNCHPGLLPEFRGCTCVEWAIYLDEQVGNTVHFMNSKIDEGPVILRGPMTFSKEDTYQSIRIKVYQENAALMAKGLKKIAVESLDPETLPLQGEGRYFQVIEEGKMQDMLLKIRDRKYKYQL